MELHEAIKIELESASGLSGKVFPLNAPEGALTPYCTYKQSGSERENGLFGMVPLMKCEFQFDAYHISYNSLESIKKSLIQLIKTFNQRNIGGSGPYIQQVEILNDFEAYESNIKLYRGIIELNLYYEEE